MMPQKKDQERDQPSPDTVNKAGVIRRLLEERLQAGEDIRSNNVLLTELQTRYPQVRWTSQDVAQNKSKFLQARRGDKPKERQEARSSGNPSPQTLRAIANLAERVGGFARLRDICDQLAKLVGEG
jgi:hypothetical protein